MIGIGLINGSLAKVHANGTALPMRSSAVLDSAGNAVARALELGLVPIAVRPRIRAEAVIGADLVVIGTPVPEPAGAVADQP